MLGDQRLQLRFPMGAFQPLPEDAFRIGAGREAAVLVQDEGHAAGHARAEIGAGPAQYDSGAAGHIFAAIRAAARSEEHTSELQSLMRISYAVFCLKKKNTTKTDTKY